MKEDTCEGSPQPFHEKPMLHCLSEDSWRCAAYRGVERWPRCTRMPLGAFHVERLRRVGAWNRRFHGKRARGACCWKPEAPDKRGPPPTSTHTAESLPGAERRRARVASRETH